MQYNLSTPITELLNDGIFSVRTYNCFHKKGWETLGDIINNITSSSDLLHIPNFGRKSFVEVNFFLKAFRNSQSGETEFSALKKDVTNYITEAYYNITEGESDVKKYLKKKYPKPSDMHELIMGNVYNMLTVISGFSKSENVEIRCAYKDFIEKVLCCMKFAQDIRNKVYEEYNRKYSLLEENMYKFSKEQIVKYFLSPLAKKYLEDSYKKQLQLKLSVRGRNLVCKLNLQFLDMIKYADKPLSEYKNLCPGQSMKKTLEELYILNQYLSTEFNRVSILSDDEIILESQKSEYPYLLSKQRTFIFDFKKAHNHLPMFFLLYHYMRLSEDRSNKLYCLLHGMFDGQERTMNELAEISGLTRERVRQIIARDVEVQSSSLAKQGDWKCYKILYNQPIITERSNIYRRIIESECIPLDFNLFASLLALVSDFQIKEIGSKRILVNAKKDGNNIYRCLEKIYHVSLAKYAKDTYIPLNQFFNKISSSSSLHSLNIIRDYAIRELNINITEDNKMFFSQNYINIIAEVYEILSDKGTPMHIDEIFNRFKEKYPAHKYTEANQLKPYLYKHGHIKSIGKTSCYALDTWDGVYFGSIRDLLVDILEKSETPLHIDTLYNNVSEHYPNTNKNSIISTMESDTLRRFVLFDSDLYGLKSKKYHQKYQPTKIDKRFSFEARFRMFKDFVETYHRFPSHNGGAQEATLMRWHYNVTNGILNATKEQKVAFNECMKIYDEKGYPCTETEYEFLMNCNKMKNYIEINYKLPTIHDAPELYTWFRRSKNNYDSYTDKRRRYMTNLFNYILSLGFSL